tara:strand:+ start:65 stop:280 length:216 start_codon:yes stop_codon:yes gene_type:complete
MKSKKKQQSIESLVNLLEKETKALESISGDLDKTLQHYKNTIDIAGNLMKQINQNKKDFDILKKSAQHLLD